MIVLHNIKEGPTSNYDSREKVKAYLDAHPTEIVTFDGVYESVYENRDLFAGRQCIMFVIGGYVGDDNYFDQGQPRERYCNWEQLLELNHMGFEWGWHTMYHPDLTADSENLIPMDIEPPFPMLHFAYPYGKVDHKTWQVVQEAGFRFAYSLGKGEEDDRFNIPRHHI